MSLVQFLFSFEGRVRRLHLWLYVLVVSALSGGVFWQFGRIFRMHRIDAFMVPHAAWHFNGLYFVSHAPLAGVVGLMLTWMHLAVFTKRWHDRDKSGWMVLINLIPFVGVLWTLIECGFLDGTQGPNKYGASPKGL